MFDPGSITLGELDRFLKQHKTSTIKLRKTKKGFVLIVKLPVSGEHPGQFQWKIVRFNRNNIPLLFMDLIQEMLQEEE